MKASREEIIIAYLKVHTNLDLKILLYVRLHIKIVLRKLHILKIKNSRVIYP